jgi:hypothetical protein
MASPGGLDPVLGYGFADRLDTQAEQSGGDRP